MNTEPIPITLGVMCIHRGWAPVHHMVPRVHTSNLSHFSMNNPPGGMFLGGGRKPENPEETHADMSTSSMGSNQGPWSCVAVTATCCSAR